ncbi:hypothetical protein [Prevotella intermedia]|uniref:Uncharacterized protein n=1 Tax=Prevotella intermedia TaxID=28131 RepID=A0A2G9IGQ3_PREIN|nr:hypothetical protein [Prevotella intermedia]PIN28957.1 hypothetical protein CUC04_05900 [Prevotella intermedia]
MKNNCENDELKEYRKAVEHYARDKKDYLFHNGGNEHALIILENLFKNANYEICIAAQQLINDEVVNTDVYIDSMREFLNREKTKLRIILAQKPDGNKLREKQHSFYRMLYNHPAYAQNRIEIKAGKTFKTKKNGMEHTVDFCTGDSRMYRFEFCVDSRQAIANFNDEEATRGLNAEFDKAFTSLDYRNKVDLKNIFGSGE